MDEFLTDFVVECTEALASIDQQMLSLERDPSNLEALKSAFRAIHTVKGTCGMFGLHRLEKVAHAAEDVLGSMREGRLAVTTESVTPVLQAIDLVKEIIEALGRDKREPAGDDAALISKLRGLVPEGRETVSLEAVPGPVPQPEPQAPTPSLPVSTAATVTGAGVVEQSLRVSINVLDSLMNLVGELVLTRNQLVQLVRGDDESRYQAPIQQISRVTSGLQEAVLQTRMQPVGNAWSKLPRIVRDLEVATGKRIELVMQGQETEVDRQVLQAIQDPMIHCVRNSCDHGLELPEARLSNKKPAHGTITLSACHEGGHIVIEIRDDGAGVNVAAVRKRIVERGLATQEVADGLTDAQLIRYLFEPGFSTAKQVTEISGRGVGMDVVKSNIEGIGGQVDLLSEPGLGSTVRIKIPLTLAIISALIVRVGGERGEIFAIPQVGVLELVRVFDGNRHLVEQIHGTTVYRLRERLLPLLSLAEILGLDPPKEKVVGHADDFSIVVVQVGESRFGLVVDEIFDTQEIVVKPVGKLLRAANLYTGSTILGDGRVVIILDTARLASRAQDIKAQHAAGRNDDIAVRAEHEKLSVLLFSASNGTPLAVPVGLVSRLEEFSYERVEQLDGKYYVQYRGGLLPLLPCHESTHIEKFKGRSVPAIIFAEKARLVGVVVERIEDIVESALVVDAVGKTKDAVGVAVIAERATEVLDVYSLLTRVYPDWFASEARSDGAKLLGRVLLAEDSRFFQELLRTLLEANGYRVTVAGNGREALELFRRQADAFDLVISDIEMPEMTGLELARALRSLPGGQQLPLLALSSLSTKEDARRGIEAGFDDFLLKLDQGRLLEDIERALARVRARAAEVRS